MHDETPYPPFVAPGELASTTVALWSKRQAAAYLSWMQEQIVPRTDYLLAYLSVDPSLPHRQLLAEAGRHVQVLLSDPAFVTPSSGESEVLLRGHRTLVDRGPQLTTAGWGLASDMGLLIARLLLEDCPGWQWEIGTGPRTAIWRNLPVLALRGEQLLQPILVSTSNATALARGNWPAHKPVTPDVWAELYYWDCAMANQRGTVVST